MVIVAPLGFETHDPLVNPLFTGVAESVHGGEPPRGATPIDAPAAPSPIKTSGNRPPLAKAGDAGINDVKFQNGTQPARPSGVPTLLSSDTTRAMFEILAPLPAAH